jgi:hypothetical protein
MCLAKLTKAPRIKYGYKVFWQSKSSFRFRFRDTGKKLPTGKWLKEEDFRDSNDPNGQEDCIRISHWISHLADIKYKKGFHVYDNEDDAKAHRYRGLVVKKVQVFMVVAHGIEVGYQPVTVCKRMKILDD